MDNETYEPVLYTLIDEEGGETIFELLGSYEEKERKYYALTPYIEDDEEYNAQQDLDVVVMESFINENGDEELTSIDDDDEYDRIGDILIAKINSENAEDEQ